MKYNIKNYKTYRYNLIEDLISRGLVFFRIELDLLPQYDNMEAIREKGTDVLDWVAKCCGATVGQLLPTVSFCYLVVGDEAQNLNKKAKYCRLLVGIKNIGFEANIKLKLLEIFGDFTAKPCVELLESSCMVKSYWDILTGDLDFYKEEDVCSKFKYHYMYVFHTWEYIQKTGYINYIDTQDYFFEEFAPYGKDKEYLNNADLCVKNIGYKDINDYYLKYEGLPCVTENSSEEYKLFNLLKVFLKLNNILVSNNLFLNKVQKSHNSYLISENIDLSYLKNNMVFILEELKYELSVHLEYVDLNKLLYDNCDKVFEKISNNLNVLASVKLNKNYIEFKNGFYDMTSCSFIPFGNTMLCLDSSSWVIGFFDQEYKEIYPKNWIKKIKDNNIGEKADKVLSNIKELLKLDGIGVKNKRFMYLLQETFGEKAENLREMAANIENIYCDLSYLELLLKESIICNDKEWSEIKQEIPYIIIYCNNI